jgi:HicA toxin of bacterial toxin-antitoxin,
MRRRLLLDKLARGSFRNVAFADMLHLMAGFGFSVARIKGSHHLLAHPGVPELVNLQEVRGEAKPYQIRQALRLVERYNLELEDTD